MPKFEMYRNLPEYLKCDTFACDLIDLPTQANGEIFLVFPLRSSLWYYSFVLEPVRPQSDRLNPYFPVRFEMCHISK